MKKALVLLFVTLFTLPFSFSLINLSVSYCELLTPDIDSDSNCTRFFDGITTEAEYFQTEARFYFQLNSTYTGNFSNFYIKTQKYDLGGGDYSYFFPNSFNVSLLNNNNPVYFNYSGDINTQGNDCGSGVKGYGYNYDIGKNITFNEGYVTFKATSNGCTPANTLGLFQFVLQFTDLVNEIFEDPKFNLTQDKYNDCLNDNGISQVRVNITDVYDRWGNTVYYDYDCYPNKLDYFKETFEDYPYYMKLKGWSNSSCEYQTQYLNEQRSYVLMFNGTCLSTLDRFLGFNYDTEISMQVKTSNNEEIRVSVLNQNEDYLFGFRMVNDNMKYDFYHYNGTDYLKDFDLNLNGYVVLSGFKVTLKVDWIRNKYSFTVYNGYNFTSYVGDLLNSTYKTLYKLVINPVSIDVDVPSWIDYLEISTLPNYLNWKLYDNSSFLCTYDTEGVKSGVVYVTNNRMFAVNNTKSFTFNVQRECYKNETLSKFWIAEMFKPLGIGLLNDLGIKDKFYSITWVAWLIVFLMLLFIGGITLSLILSSIMFFFIAIWSGNTPLVISTLVVGVLFIVGKITGVTNG